MELVELVRGAQEAMDRGDYRLATAAGAHGLSAYPSCLAAHRILGEAFLELGATDPATRHFEHTLSVDPLNVVARLGLGVASEERKDYRQAYAHYLHAWEINPALDQVRDELVRLRGLLRVVDRLHPTRAGLAGIHVRGGQLRRAANEWRAILAIEPESLRARTAFAELLWRQGEDDLAAVACRDALRGGPENARALAMLADTERRRGAAGAVELGGRYRAVDPTGDVVRLLGDWRPDVDFLIVESALVDDFDFSAHAVAADRVGAPAKTATNALAGNQIAAPDLWDTLVKDLSSELPSTGIAPTLAVGVEPFAWADGGPEPVGADEFVDFGIQPFNVDDLGAAGGPPPYSFSEPQEAVPDVSSSDIYLAALGREATPAPQSEPGSQAPANAEEDELPALFAPSTDRALTDAPPAGAAVDAGSAGPWGGSGVGARTNGISLDGFDDLAALGIEPFSLDGMFDEPPDVDDPASFEPRRTASPEASLSDPVVEPPVVPPAAVPSLVEPAAAPPVFVDPFLGADGKIDLTAGRDDLDKSLAAATPSFDAAGRYDGLSVELDLDGIVPFDAAIPGEDDDAWAPLTDDDIGAAPTAAAPPAHAVPVARDAGPAGAEPVDGWSTGDGAGAFDEPSALDALMAIPPIDSPVMETATTETSAPVAGRSGMTGAETIGDTEEDLLIGRDLQAIPITFDDDLLFGIPPQQASGYTELFRHVDAEELGAEERAHAEIDPFASPDASGEPLAFEDLLAVTSRDRTAPLVARGPEDAEPADSPFDFSDTDPSVAVPAAVGSFAATDIAALDLSDVAPFDIADLEVGAVAASTDEVEVEVEPPGDVLGEPALGFEAGLGAGEPLARHQENGEGTGFPSDPDGDMTPVEGDAGANGAWAGLDSTPFDGEAAPAEASLVDSELIAPDVGAPEPFAATTFDGVDRTSEGIPEAPAPGWSGSSGLGMAIGSVVWPAFVNQTSDLIDRDRGNGSIFVRLRASKATLVADGLLAVDRRLVASVTFPPAANITAEATDPVDAGAPADQAGERRKPHPEMSEQTRLDLMAMRVRLIEDADAAGEVAATVEKAVGEGLADPHALRILGEAYLKLGKMEQAAAQFRQAMLARQRTR